MDSAAGSGAAGADCCEISSAGAALAVLSTVTPPAATAVFRNVLRALDIWLAGSFIRPPTNETELLSSICSRHNAGYTLNWQREILLFYVDKLATKPADNGIEFSAFRSLQILKELTHPGPDIGFKKNELF